MKVSRIDQLPLIGFNLLKSFYLESQEMIKAKIEKSRFDQLFNAMKKKKMSPMKSRIESPNSYCETDNSSDSSFLSHTQLNPFALNITFVLNQQDTRTTVMIKNIPNKFTTQDLVGLLNETCKGTFDLVYLPIDKKLKKNYGYAFINFTHFIYIIQFYSEFKGRNWSGTNSKKICEIAYSKVQGRNTILNHYSHKGIYIASRFDQSELN